MFLINYFNDFKQNSDEFTGLNLSYLFSDVKSDKKAYYPASVVPVARRLNDRIPKFIKLDSIDDFTDYEQLFITKEMIELYNQDDSIKAKKRILLDRKRLIQNAEKQFVESMGIVYDET